MPDRVVVLFGALAGFLSVTGSLSTLVEAASLVFLLTFGLVNILALKQIDRHRWMPMMSLDVGIVVLVLLVLRLAVAAPIPLSLLIAVLVMILTLRPIILRHVRTYHESGEEREDGQ